MSAPETGRVGKRGTWVIPAALRGQFHLEEGALLIAEAQADGILLRPAIALAVETYAPARRAAFLLENAVDAADYAGARRAGRAMGLDPDAVPHEPPVGTAARKRRGRRG